MCKKNQLLVQAPSLFAKSWLCFWSHYGFKNVRNVIEMALKSPFFASTSQKSPSGRAALPQTTSVIRLTCSGLFSTGPKLDNFCAKKKLLLQSPSSKQTLGRASARTHCRQIFKRSNSYRPYTKRANKRFRIFFRHEYKFFKTAHNLKL